MILSPSPWWSVIPSLGAALGYALLALRPVRPAAIGINTLMLLVWLLHTLALVSGHAVKPVRFGFAPAL